MDKVFVLMDYFDLKSKGERMYEQDLQTRLEQSKKRLGSDF